MAASDKLPTLWDYQPHTQAKHRILRAYLDGWFPIVASIKKAKRALFLDGFAGPGEYSKGEEGSPAIAMRAAFEHNSKFLIPVRLAFIEADPDRHSHLCKVVERYRGNIGSTVNKIEVKEPILGDCSVKLDEALATYEQRKLEFGPALVFLDQFGYSDVPMALVARILANPRCEVFTYMHAEGMTRFLGQHEIHSSVSKAFGSDQWRSALEFRTEDRARELAKEYELALREKAGAKYVWRFAMHGLDGRLIYWLFFCTNERKGLEVMKAAMRKVDTSGGRFSFSDARHPEQMVMFDECDENWLSSHLSEQFGGKEVTADEVEEYVLTSTPLVACKLVLRELERAGRLEIRSPPPARRKGTFKDPTMMIRFL